MLNQAEAERGLVYSLLRRSGEDIADALERVAMLPIAVEAADIADPQLRTLLALILDEAAREVAVSTYLAAQATGADEFDLVQSTESVDPGALRVYAEAVAYHSARRQISSVARKAVDAARNADPDQALNQITEQFASISLASEDGRIATVSERLVEGRAIHNTWQAGLASGEVRVSFPIPTLNDWLPLLPGNAILLTAASKVGKSSLAGQFFDHNLKRGMRGVLFHFEDTTQVTYTRRLARQMAKFCTQNPPTYKRMLHSILNEQDERFIDAVEHDIRGWSGLGTEVYCAGWTMEQVVRTWHRLCIRARAEGDPIKFVIVDYLNKAELTPQQLKSYGLFAARGRGAELVKRAAEMTGTIVLLVQQESVEGTPYESRQSWHKSQVWLRLVRERLPNNKLDPIGDLIVANANNGETGTIRVEFLPDWMLWKEL